MDDKIITKLQIRNIISVAGILALIILIDFMLKLYINYNTAKKIYKENK